MVQVSKDQKALNLKRDYVLYDPQLRYLIGTFESFGHQMDKNRLQRIEEIIRKEKKRKNKLNFTELKKDKIQRPKSAISPNRDYILHEPKFRDLQENYLSYFNQPKLIDVIKHDLRRKKRLSTIVRNKKENIIEKRKAHIDELEEKLKELEKIDDSEMEDKEKSERKQQIKNLKSRIQRDTQKLRYDFLPKKTSHAIPSKSVAILKWNNPPKYNKSMPHLRQVMEVKKNHEIHMEAKQKDVLENIVNNILVEQEEYAAWKRQM